MLLAGLSYAQQSQPQERTPTPNKIDKYVVDKTGTLTSDQISYLMKKLVNFEKETSNQLVVFIIPSLNGEPIEQVAFRIAEENNVGQKGKDNGVLLLIAMNDKKMRIEVGYGLEGALPDATALSIINNEIKPEFQKGDYYTGIDNGIEAIMAATKGEYTPEESGDGFDVGICGIPFFVIGIFGVIFFMIVFSIIQSIFGCGKGWTKGGSAKSGAGGWWSSGSGSSWSSGSSGSSFGSFSGGGGSFGGGGASGGW